MPQGHCRPSDAACPLAAVPLAGRDLPVPGQGPARGRLRFPRERPRPGRHGAAGDHRKQRELSSAGPPPRLPVPRRIRDHLRRRFPRRRARRPPWRGQRDPMGQRRPDPLHGRPGGRLSRMGRHPVLGGQPPQAYRCLPFRRARRTLLDDPARLTRSDWETSLTTWIEGGQQMTELAAAIKAFLTEA